MDKFMIRKTTASGTSQPILCNSIQNQKFTINSAIFYFTNFFNFFIIYFIYFFKLLLLSILCFINDKMDYNKNLIYLFFISKVGKRCARPIRPLKRIIHCDFVLQTQNLDYHSHFPNISTNFFY